MIKTCGVDHDLVSFFWWLLLHLNECFSPGCYESFGFHCDRRLLKQSFWMDTFSSWFFFVDSCILSKIHINGIVSLALIISDKVRHRRCLLRQKFEAVNPQGVLFRFTDEIGLLFNGLKGGLATKAQDFAQVWHVLQFLSTFVRL